MASLEGKVALVTGAGQGQGRSHVLRLAAEGARVVAVDRCRDYATVPYPMATEADLKAVGEEATEAGGEVSTVVADVRDRAGMRRVVDEAVAAWGSIDVVVANAGIATYNKRFWEWDDQSWDDMLDVNLRGVWHTCAAAAPHMIEGGRGGSIVVTASMAGLGASQNVAPYAASKHGVVGLTKAMAAELAEHGIRVNAIAPTSVNTNMIDNPTVFKLFRPDLETPTREDTVETFRSLVGLPRPWLEPSEVSDLVAFLASEASRSMTGAIIPLDLGEALR